jgi:cytochrome c553
MIRMLLSAGTLFLLVIGTAQAADDVVAGKTKAVACAACHGVVGQGPNVLR